MISFLKMKRNEWKVKAMLYGTILTMMENRRGALELLQNLYLSLKDVPADQLQKEFVEKLAEVIHSDNQGQEERRV